MEFGTSYSNPTRIVGEIGNQHDGSLGDACRMTEAIASAGADAVKYQLHLADYESTEAERWPARFDFHPQDKSRQAFWRRIQFDIGQWRTLTQTAREAGLEVIVSVFCIEAVAWAEKLADRIKIPSGQVTDLALVEAVGKVGLPVVLSSGFATEDEIDKAIDYLGSPTREDIHVLQCTTEYPCPPERIGLNLVDRYSRNLAFLGGLSDHSGTIAAGIAAAALNASMVEVHVCWHKRQFGPDVSSALTIDELAELCRGVRFVNKARMFRVDKDVMAEYLKTHGDVACYVDGKRRRKHKPDYERSQTWTKRDASA